jgi:Domain of unknown function (DUF4157)
MMELQQAIGNQAVLRMLDNHALSQEVSEAVSSPGQPLDEPIRATMEPRFGRDFSRVRIHTGSDAAASAQTVNACAYTVGDDIVYSAGEYDPRSFEGRRLLAHELTHVVQQPDGGAPGATDALRVSEPVDAAESEAHSLSDRVAAGESARPSVVAGPVRARDASKP